MANLLTSSKKNKKDKSSKKSYTSNKPIWYKENKIKGHGSKNAAKGINEEVIAFTAGSDAILDQQIAYYDVVASAAQAKALAKAKIISSSELKSTLNALSAIANEALAGNFAVPSGMEDCHSAIESALKQKIGDTGLKIHTGRSRNDQVAVAMRLFLKDELYNIMLLCEELALEFAKLAKAHEFDVMPGYTHTKKAMISSFGLWLDCHSDAFSQNAKAIQATIDLLDKSPLGSASGFGTPANLDREYTAKLLGFSGVEKNAMYSQNMRIKAEAIVLSLLSQIMADSSRFASDVIFFSAEGIDYVKINPIFTTGSSLMPNKQNPDVFELIRAKSHSVLAHAIAVESLQIGLVSGYNRDAQQSKGHVISAFFETSSSLAALQTSIQFLKLNTDAAAKACTLDLLATDNAIAKAISGVPFRKAYQMSAPDIADSKKIVDKNTAVAIIKSRKSTGATGNLKINVKAKMASLKNALDKSEAFKLKPADCLKYK